MYIQGLINYNTIIDKFSLTMGVITILSRLSESYEGGGGGGGRNKLS